MIVVGRLLKAKTINATSRTTEAVYTDSAPTSYFDDEHGSVPPFIFRHPFSSFGLPRNSSRFQFHNFDEAGQNSPSHNLTADDEAPPERLTADYVEIGILIAMVLIGGPLNFVSLFRSMRSDPPYRFCSFLRLRLCRNSKSSRHTFDLKIHLTVANLLVIWVYALSDLCWLATYNWRGGDFMCRIVRFVHAFCFYATSNLVTTIAIQRLSVAMKLDRPAARRLTNAGQSGRWGGGGGGGGRGRPGPDISKLAYGAWTLAFLCSIPQLIIWRTYELYPDYSWNQCVTIWTIEKYKREQLGETENAEGENPSNIDPSQTELENQEKIYNGLHLAFVFWLPVLIIVFCYVLIVTRFHRKIRKQTMQIAAEATAEAESRAAHVRASLVLGGPVDAGSPLLLPIAVYRALQYQTIQTDNDSPECSSTNQTRRRTIPNLRPRPPRPFLFLPVIGRRHRLRSTGRVDAMPNDSEWDQSSSVTASILKATLIGGGGTRPHARKSFAIATLSKAKTRTMKKTIWILLAYLLCWSPYNVLVLWRYVDRNVDLYDFEIMYNLIVLNAVVNPLIYGI